MTRPERRHTGSGGGNLGATGSARASGSTPRVFGYVAVFNSSADIGGRFTEEIAPGAFRDVIGTNVRGLFNHDPDHLLGREGNGTLRLSEDAKGLRFEIDLNVDDPTAMQLHARVKRGDLAGNSFSFSVEEDGEELGTKDGKRHRIIKRVSKLYDVGPVTFPAYESTEISARCAAWADCGEKRGESLAAAMNSAIAKLGDDAPTQAEIGSAGGISASTVGQILAGEINCPPLSRLEGFARVLKVSVGSLVSAAEKDGCSYDRSSRRLTIEEERARLDAALQDRPRSRRFRSIAQERQALNAALRDMDQPQHSNRNSRSGGVASKDHIWRACIHEASHAVVSLSVGRGCTSVHVRRDGSGTTRFGDGGLRAPAVALAGPISEGMAFKGPGHTQCHRTHMKRARDQARRCIQSRSGEGRTVDQLLQQEDARAEQILEERWSDVLKVATALQDRGSLTGVELKQVLGLSSDNNYGPRAA